MPAALYELEHISLDRSQIRVVELLLDFADKVVSRRIAPVPANKSRASMPLKSIRFSSTLKMFSRAKSVVGRAFIFVGTSKRLRPYLPLIIRILILFFHFSCSLGKDNIRGESDKASGFTFLVGPLCMFVSGGKGDGIRILVSNYRVECG